MGHILSLRFGSILKGNFSKKKKKSVETHLQLILNPKEIAIFYYYYYY